MPREGLTSLQMQALSAQIGQIFNEHKPPISPSDQTQVLIGVLAATVVSSSANAGKMAEVLDVVVGLQLQNALEHMRQSLGTAMERMEKDRRPGETKEQQAKRRVDELLAKVQMEGK